MTLTLPRRAVVDPDELPATVTAAGASSVPAEGALGVPSDPEREWLRKLNWGLFETLVESAFTRDGFEVSPVPQRVSGRADMLLQRHEEKYLVQCKHWKAWQVGTPAIAELLELMDEAGCSGGLLITAGKFSPEAVELAQRSGLLLLDGDDVLRMASGAPVLPLADETTSQWALPKGWTAYGAPTCPLCEEPMLYKRVRAGEQAGMRFWGCRHYPECRAIREVGPSYLGLPLERPAPSAQPRPAALPTPQAAPAEDVAPEQADQAEFDPQPVLVALPAAPAIVTTVPVVPDEPTAEPEALGAPEAEPGAAALTSAPVTTAALPAAPVPVALPVVEPSAEALAPQAAAEAPLTPPPAEVVPVSTSVSQPPPVLAQTPLPGLMAPAAPTEPPLSQPVVETLASPMPSAPTMSGAAPLADPAPLAAPEVLPTTVDSPVEQVETSIVSPAPFEPAQALVEPVPPAPMDALPLVAVEVEPHVVPLLPPDPIQVEPQPAPLLPPDPVTAELPDAEPEPPLAPPLMPPGPEESYAVLLAHPTWSDPRDEDDVPSFVPEEHTPYQWPTSADLIDDDRAPIMWPESAPEPFNEVAAVEQAAPPSQRRHLMMIGAVLAIAAVLTIGVAVLIPAVMSAMKLILH
jgi:hypothetical protein